MKDFTIQKLNFFPLLQMVSMQFNPFTWGNRSRNIHSKVFTLDLKDDNKNSVEVLELSSDILIKIPLNSAGPAKKKQLYFTNNMTSRFHEITVAFPYSLIQLEITPMDAAVNLVIFVRFGYRPTIQEHDLNGTVSSNKWCIWRRVREKYEWERVCSLNGQAPIQVVSQKPGKYYVEVRSHEGLIKLNQGEERAHYGHGTQKVSCVDVKDPPPTPSKGKKEIGIPEYDPRTDTNYTMQAALVSCVYWSNKRQIWTTEGCKVRFDSNKWNYMVTITGYNWLW